MTSWVVLDSGVLLASVLEEQLTPQAQLLLRSFEQQKLSLAAPSLFRYEVVSVIRKSVARGILPASRALSVFMIVMDYPVIYSLDEGLLKSAYQIATRLNRPTAYDSQYLALAERLGCEFWTTDERLYNAAHSSLSYIRWIGALGT